MHMYVSYTWQCSYDRDLIAAGILSDLRRKSGFGVKMGEFLLLAAVCRGWRIKGVGESNREVWVVFLLPYGSVFALL